LPLRLLPHRYTMKVCTPSSATSAEAKLAAITHRNAGDAARAGAMPATHAGSVPAGSMNGRAFTASSGEGSKRTSPPAS
jgi:hypothetical protein